MENIPVQHDGLAANGRGAGASTPNGRFRGNKKKLTALVGGIAALLMVGVIGWLVYQSGMPATIDRSKYQAVFLSNGQVYFGKLQTLSGGYFKLTDIFYLQAQNKDASKNPQDAAAAQAQDVQLIKLGSEVHGPDDEMVIDKDQILFFENLKKDGKVSDSIKQYLEQKK